MRKGEWVRVRLAGTSDEWCRGVVAIASKDGKSVGLLLDGAVRAEGGGFIMGALPLMVDYEHEEVLGLDGSKYEVEVPAL